jgi:broad specificity phosphatase PhoE
MGTLYLVRHGQASFGSDDYDRLSELGTRQCRRLGEYFRARGVQFEAAYTGTLRRHLQSMAAIVDGLGGKAPQPQALPGLNEYDAESLVRTLHPAPMPSPHTAEGVRYHFRVLREGLLQWMTGQCQPAGTPSWADFSAGVADALERIRLQHSRHVLVVSSGGPIAAAIGRVLDTPPSSVVELNMRMRNSAVTEFTFTPKRHSLVTYNALPHLEGVSPEDWVTHS